MRIDPRFDDAIRERRAEERDKIENFQQDILRPEDCAYYDTYNYKK